MLFLFRTDDGERDGGCSVSPRLCLDVLSSVRPLAAMPVRDIGRGAETGVLSTAGKDTVVFCHLLPCLQPLNFLTASLEIGSQIYIT